MIEELKPSEKIWKHCHRASRGRKKITGLSVASAIADLLAGYDVSYTARAVLKDLGLLDPHGRPNNDGIWIMAHYLHEKFHRKREGVVVINQTTSKNKKQTGK